MADWPQPPQPYINVKDRPYRATGDGTTDDTTAIQAAIDAAGTRDATVIFPPGTYMVSRLVLKAHMIGTMERNTTIKSVATNTTADGTGVLTTNAGFGGVSGLYLRSLTIDGNKANNAGKVIHGIDEGRSIRMNDCVVQSCTRNGIDHETGNAAQFHRVKIDQNDGHGIRIGDTDDHMFNCIVSESGLHGVFADGAGVSCWNVVSGNAGLVDGVTSGDGFYFNSSNVRCFGCQSNDNARHGVYFDQSVGASGSVFEGWIRENLGDAVKLTNSEEATVLVTVDGVGVKKHAHIVELTGTCLNNRVHAHYSSNALIAAATAVEGTTTGNDIWASVGQAESNMALVEHGATGSTVRPETSASALWIGSATPANALDGDLWVDTT
jgi:hypothetical protein